ncbi:MAG: hypothetical protein FJ403_02075 [Verrucomicrobia bacterium]|nr:hypothetical protein [Verrucomicrobiota bacterium]
MSSSVAFRILATWSELAKHQPGGRFRTRVIDVERLCWRLRTGSLEEVGRNLDASLKERIARGEVRREPRWTESLAVGSLGFLERVKPLILSRRAMESAAADDDLWVLQEEEAAPYGRKTGPEIGSKAAN